MLDRLPQFIDPVSFADKQRVLVGHIPLAKFTRLADMLQDTGGMVAIDFSFGKEERRSVIRGYIKADLSLVCRTCLEAIDFPVNIAVNLAVVQTLEQADRLGGRHEPLLLEEEKIALHELVEDELLLALPDFPRHQQKCVPYKQQHTEEIALVEPKQVPSNNPFSVLATFKPIGD